MINSQLDVPQVPLVHTIMQQRIKPSTLVRLNLGNTKSIQLLEARAVLIS